MPRLTLEPINLVDANDFIRRHHRHHKPVVGQKFAIGCRDDESGVRVGVAVVSRPVSRGVTHYTAEVTRLCTDGTRNACSFLYSACARAAAAMGYRLIQTYILRYENGASLKASGWILDGWTDGGDWNHGKDRRGTRRVDQPMGKKQRWVKTL